MKVMVTGGTGFVGSHLVESLLAAGHEVRLLARSPEKVQRVLRDQGMDVRDVVYGDMADAARVREALEGCDAVVHAAAAVEINARERILESNIAGNHNVLGIAAELGLDPIVYVSSIATMFPPPGPVHTVDDPLVSLDGDYGRSKTDGERYARGLQEQGSPIVIFYPAGVYGPRDPGIGAPLQGLVMRYEQAWMITAGGNTLVDVRDLARMMTKVIDQGPGRGARRYMAGGHFVTWAQEADICERITGRKVRRLPAPVWLVHAIGAVVDLVQWIWPRFDFPLTREAARYAVGGRPCDSRKTVEELGIEFRPIEETLADATFWLVDSGHLDPKWARKRLDG
jgi:nucleoside-diphosphate-sugar epimerase